MDLLSRYHDARRWARRRPGALGILDVELYQPVQLVLRSVYEARGVRYALRPAMRRSLAHVDGPDPWSVALRFPEHAPVGTEVAVAVERHLVPMDCGLCSAAGDRLCPACGGRGVVREDRADARCWACRGRCVIVCRMCEGSGGVIGTPTVWARIESHDEVRAIGTDELPLEVAFDLVEPKEHGEILHREDGERVHEMSCRGGYREPAHVAAGVGQAARSLCRSTGVPEGGRIRAQRLEVRRLPVFRVSMLGGHRVWVWDDPPKVTPAANVETLALRAMRALPLAAAGGAAAATAWWWLASGL